MSTTVFISSTSRDLLDHRRAVRDALLNAGFHPIDMANFMARPEGATSACLKEVAESDLFVGIYAWRYGFIPPDSEVSITEQEYLEAEKLGKPRFCFVVDEGHNWPEEFKEKGISARLLRDFKTKLDATLVRTTFTTPNDLAMKVLASLQRWEREHSAADAQKAAETSAPSTGGINISDISGGNINLGNLVTGNVGGDVVAGDKIGGDKVMGDKVEGDKINVGDISGSTGVAIGRGASATVTQSSGLSGEDLAKLFTEIRQQIEARPADPDVEKGELKDTVDKIEQETAKGEQANTKKVSRWLGNLADMAPDIFEVTVATLTNPAVGIATAIKKIAAKAKEEAS